MAQYAIFMYAPSNHVSADAEPQGREVYDRYAEDLRSSGAMVAAFALERAAPATSLCGDVLTDGPFLEAKEVIIGVYVLDAPDLDAALALARKNPILAAGGGLEVRPVEP